MMYDFRKNQSAGILNSVYKNAQMAYQSTDNVLKRCKNNNLFREISREQARYKAVANRARAELERRGARAEDPSAIDRFTARAGIAVRTMNNQSGSNIARIMLGGTTMGIIDMQRALNRAHNAEEPVKKSAERLIQREQSFCESLKKYL